MVLMHASCRKVCSGGKTGAPATYQTTNNKCCIHGTTTFLPPPPFALCSFCSLSIAASPPCLDPAMRTVLPSPFGVLAALAAVTSLASAVAAQDASPAGSKRGISYHNDTAAADYDVLLAESSPVSWYYTWSPRPGPAAEVFPWGFRADVEFVPTIHGTGRLDQDIADLDRLNASSRHLFTFNEPDEPAATGGSNLSPRAAAEAYIARIVPLRSRFRISHPSVTGSQRGFAWLAAFHDECRKIDPKHGCPADFVVVHWYGGFDGLAGWLAQLRQWYTEAGYVAAAAATAGDGSSGTTTAVSAALPFWLGELGIPGAPMDANLAMMSQTLPYLDSLPWVARYAWFGTFRPAQANAWTGVGVAFFDDSGGLTDLGSRFLGGPQNGFPVGKQGRPPPAPPPPTSSSVPEPGPSPTGAGNAGARAHVPGRPVWLALALAVFTLQVWL
ncbi:glycosyl hydrolase [Microdochium nivale]|nr:glycosyl hydrolase [Microdochium nivale]